MIYDVLHDMEEGIFGKFWSRDRFGTLGMVCMNEYVMASTVRTY
jgi:hypothetical protein